MLALLLLLFLSLLSRSQPLSTPPAPPFPAFTTLSAPALSILQLGAALDRGQAYNPTSGAHYESSMRSARSSIEALVASAPPPDSVAPCLGEWELVLSTVPHGIFRSSPFFLAVQEAFSFAENGTAFGQDKAGLFFKLHELQTCSWGVSKVGRVGQRILPDGRIYSEFDTSIFSLTVVPIVGWFKLLPTFGGCVITKADYEAEPTEEGLRMAMNVDYTTSRPVPGLSGLGEFIWRIKVSAGPPPDTPSSGLTPDRRCRCAPCGGCCLGTRAATRRARSRRCTRTSCCGSRGTGTASSSSTRGRPCRASSATTCRQEEESGSFLSTVHITKAHPSPVPPPPSPPLARTFPPPRLSPSGRA